MDSAGFGKHVIYGMDQYAKTCHTWCQKKPYLYGAVYDMYHHFIHHAAADYSSAPT